MMSAEDRREHEEIYLDGLHFWLNQPEFNTGQRMMPLVELFEQRRLVELVVPDEMKSHEVKVIIGKNNRAQAIQECSVVISQYGLADEARGTIGVIGPTRMPYARAISTIGYLASVMDTLVAELYGKKPAPGPEPAS